ncbi:hypothetical protein [Streptomyces sp. rh34]|nr:hypothetical protein [Streptomyces sp. rh34]
MPASPRSTATTTEATEETVRSRLGKLRDARVVVTGGAASSAAG